MKINSFEMARLVVARVFFVSLLLAWVSGCTSGDEGVAELVFAHAAPESDVQQDLARFFAEEVQTRSVGELSVQVFPHGQLGNDQQMITAVRSGVIDIAMVGLNNFEGLMPEVGVLHLPYMFVSREHAYRVLDGEIGQQFLSKFGNFGLQGLGFPENGYRNITNSRGPIRSPADTAGLSIRTNTSKPLNEMFAMLGANPQPLPVAELYVALETGVVDAQEHPINITHSFRYDEVQEYLSLTEHSYGALVIVMNLNVFNSLSDPQKQLVREVASEATNLQRRLSMEMEAGILLELEERGMQINRDVDKLAFQQATLAIRDGYIDEYGNEIILKIAAAE